MILIYVVAYFATPPLLMTLLRSLKTYIKNELFGRKQSKTAIAQASKKEGLNEKISKRVRFTLRDPRNKPVPFRLIFVLIYILGAIVAAIGGGLGNFTLLIVALVIAYADIVFAYTSANGIVTERDTVLRRMVELKSSKMRLANREKGVITRPSDEFTILQWSKDLIHPEKMHVYMPTDFDLLSVDSFLESWNLVFGSEGQWIADKTDEHYGGFDFNAGVAAIRVSPKLPTRADWHTRYLNPEHIHWGFFPLAIGSENGVPIYNETIDATEHILGFSVNSGQNKLSAKNGVVLGSEIVAAPQVLIAGGTGGGKALASNTKVKVLKEN